VLQLCADFADIDGDSDSRSSSSSLFGSLIFLIRDFQNGDIYEEDPGYFQKLVSNVESTFEVSICLELLLISVFKVQEDLKFKWVQSVE